MDRWEPAEVRYLVIIKVPAGARSKYERTTSKSCETLEGAKMHAARIDDLGNGWEVKRIERVTRERLAD